jgi:hypothetical protein
MGTPNTLATAASLLMRNYDMKVTEEVYSRNWITLSKVRKEPKAGNPHHLPIARSDGAGVSSDMSVAEAATRGISSANFSVELADMYGSVQLATKTRKGFKGKASLVADYVKKEIDAKMNGMGRHQSRLLFGGGGGSLGRVQGIATNTFTLTNANDIVNFWEGQQLVYSTGDGTSSGHTLRGGSPGYLTIQSVDRNAGTFITDAVAGVTGVAANDYIFLRGAFAGNVSQTSIFKGFGAWFPTAAPTDTLWGVARTGQSDLAGFITPAADAVGGPLQRIGKALVHGYTFWNATPRDVVVHPKQKHQIVVSMQNQGIREISVGETAGTAGYSKLTYTAEFGEVNIWSDPMADAQIAYMLDFSSFCIRHLGEKMIDFDQSEDGSGSIWFPSTGLPDAGHYIRLVSYSNLFVETPWKNGTVGLAAV